MSIQSLNMRGQILGADDQTPIDEGMVYFTFWSDKDTVDGTMVIDGNKPEYGDKPFMLKVTKTSGETFSGRIKLNMPPGDVPDLDRALTIFTISFEDAVWHSQQLLGFLRY